MNGVNVRKPEKLSDCITYRRNVLVTKHQVGSQINSLPWFGLWLIKCSLYHT